MSDRHKYAFNGEWFFENAREHIERDDFPHIPIGKVGGVNGWALGIYRHHLDNRQFPVFFFTLDQKPKFKICCYTSILKNDGSLSSVCNRYVESDSMVISISLILDEENRYLTNGGLKIEYGFQIEGILSSDNIWTFNFHDRLFDSEEKMNMITFYSGSKAVPMKLFHCHKQASLKSIK
uniref:MATH domain-containing protein n=1 Tax=Caenorhabditis tropicalis TaxID=1561998 RepID=A0A1I7UKR9_9PELO